MSCLRTGLSVRRLGRFTVAIGATIFVAIVFATRGHGQTAGTQPIVVLDVGLPAVDTAMKFDETRAPGTPETRKRQNIHTAAESMRTSGARAAYRPGRVLVKSREGAGSSRVTTMRAVSAG